MGAALGTARTVGLWMGCSLRHNKELIATRASGLQLSAAGEPLLRWQFTNFAIALLGRPGPLFLSCYSARSTINTSHAAAVLDTATASSKAGLCRKACQQRKSAAARTVAWLECYHGGDRGYSKGAQPRPETGPRGEPRSEPRTPCTHLTRLQGCKDAQRRAAGRAGELISLGPRACRRWCWRAARRGWRSCGERLRQRSGNRNKSAAASSRAHNA